MHQTRSQFGLWTPSSEFSKFNELSERVQASLASRASPSGSSSGRLFGTLHGLGSSAPRGLPSSLLSRRTVTNASAPPPPSSSNPSLFSSDLMKRFMQKYGKVFVTVHFTVYFGFLASIYTGLKRNVDVPGLLKKYLSIDFRKDRQEGEEPGWLEQYLGGEQGTAGTLVLAIICNKAMFFVRTPITLTLTPIIARYVQRAGLNPGKIAAEAVKGAGR